MSSVGLAMIVRNAAETLGVCLESSKDLCDQLVIVDTGSTDGTIEIAKSYGAEIYHFDWVDDFAAARNFSFDKLRTEWAWWLDGDDMVLGREHFDEMVDKCISMGLDGVVLEYLYAFDGDGEQYLAQIEPAILGRLAGIDQVLPVLRAHCVTTQYRERLVRNIPGWRWQYPIHEALPAAGKKLGKFDKLKIVHRRHLAKRAQKNRRNIDILERTPMALRDERIWFYLGLERSHHMEIDGAIDAFERYRMIGSLDDEQYLANHWLGDLYRAKGDLVKAKEAELRAVALRPSWRDAYAGLLSVAVRERRWNEAVYYGARTRTAQIPDTPYAYNPVHEETGWVLDYTQALVECGMYDEALSVTEQGLASCPSHPGFLHNLDVISSGINFRQGQKSIAETLEFFLRHDDTETAAVLISRLSPEIRTHPDVVSLVPLVNTVCGSAARGEILVDPFKTTASGVAEPNAPWAKDPRTVWLLTSLRDRHWVRDVLHVGGPQEICQFYQHLAFRGHHISNTALPDNLYDMVVLWSCLERVKQPDRLIEDAKRRLRPGGWLAAIVPNGPATRGLQPPLIEHLRLRFFSSDRLRQMLGTVDLPALLGGGTGDAGDLALLTTTSRGMQRPKSIAIVCPYSPEPWGPHSLTTGIGGSEEAVVRLSRALARRGHDVTVYGSGWIGTDLDPSVGTHTPPNYHSIKQYRHHDVLIGWRYPEIFLNQIRSLEAEWKALWLHDSIPRDRVLAASSFVDAIWCISDYHAGLYRDVPKVYRGRNGIDPHEMPDGIDKNPHKAVYVSTPFRGLDTLLEYWPQIKARIPDAELHAYYGWDSADKMGVTSTPEGRAFKERVMAMVQQPGVTWRGRIGQQDLYREIASAGTLLYSCRYQEENCCHPDTMISIPGDHRGGPPRVRISDLEGKSGFPVWTYDEIEHRFKIGTATRVWQTKVADTLLAITLDDGNVLRLTPEHHVLTREEEWKQACELEVGERLMALHCNHRIVSITAITGGPVFDMEVDGTHTFIADGVVVHNCISAYLAQACGAWPVVFPVGALPQSVVFGWKVDPSQFVDAAVEAMTTERGRDEMMRWARAYLSWDDVAERWERLWQGVAA